MLLINENLTYKAEDFQCWADGSILTSGGLHMKEY
jgi:hypothetical protein